MRVENNDIVDYLLQRGKTNGKNKSNSFDEILNLSLKKVANESKISGGVEEFKRKLTELGAYGYLTQLNADKIEQKIQQKKKELTELLGLNDASKTDSQRAELAKVVDELLSEYRKELNAAMTSSTLLERQKKLAGTSSSSVDLNSVLSEFGLL
ncbi:response regulator [Campylobacter curvus]|uniref:response regulator n=2 Tax=Campylobacter TaxID=194 RepID=UPI0014705D79|nr:response regulator [Campylobacter curvus]MBN7288610.1 response regulator [Campylobacter curvus]